MSTLIDRACDALAWLLVAPVFGFCRWVDPQFAAWSNVTGDDS